ncbi:MAG: preprotein translocase subunit YajC [Apilactobacillus sp.]|uniref:preprotein translocase subunit YajC n=1 Tax=Apilactobacillus TaxID=2767877 RepID=UPI0025D1288B|nr:preprotein translocase subunit YajC [Apilactobacillus sp.]MCT6822783.1 preprotein translocase subunit YajC [Apilactobacillus sp.]MCT6857847.1 preprotein translocase subunit YajC [Apilactobacillus sp.]
MIQNYSGFIILIVLFAIMYFLVIRPQKKQQQKHAETLKQLQKGDHVITIGRLHGIVDDINEEEKTVTLDCDGIYLVFDLTAVAKVTERVAEAKSEEATEAKEDKE